MRLSAGAMARRIAALLEILESEKRAVTGDLGRWSVEQLRFRPGSMSWSALDVLDHVARTEAEAVGHLRTYRGQGRRQEFVERLRGSCLIRLMQLPVRVQAPRAMPQILPSEGRSLAEILGEWSRTRLALQKEVRSIAPGEACCAFTQHPFSGWMNLPQTIAFLAAHIRHHRFQIDRIRNCKAWPRAALDARSACENQSDWLCGPR